jgi:hypothetical protein
MKRLKGKLTYANVISTLCLFMLLGGSAAFAATKLGKNSVGTKQIKKGAVTGIKIKKGTITGTNINLAKLGTVPTATNASTATTAGTANALAAMEPTRLVGASGQPPFLDGSSNLPAEGPFKFQPVGFYKDHEGIVHLSGVASVGKEESPIHGLLFTLPPGYRPASGVVEAFRGFEEKKTIFVFGSNVVVVGHDLSGDVFTSAASEKAELLSGITFRAES